MLPPSPAIELRDLPVTSLELSVVIPCLNEAATITTVVEKAVAAMARLHIAGEVLVADNGSTDGSVELATLAGARVVSVQERGYGSALRAGMAAARGQLLIMGDADDTYDFSNIDPFVEALKRGADMVMGTRLPPGRIMPGANPFLNRYLGTPVLTFVLNKLFGTRIRDVNCGMRGLTKEAFGRLGLESRGMEFASEMVIKAALLRLRMQEVPITLYPDRRDRAPHLRRWSDGWRHLQFMLLHAPDQLLFAPGLVAVAVGLGLAVPVSLGPVVFLGRTFDFHFLFVGGALALIGLQGALGSLVIRDIVGGLIMRPSRLASKLARELTLERGLVIAATLFLLGVLLETLVVVHWLRSRFGALNEPRRSVLALLLMAAAAEIALFSFLHAVLKRHGRASQA